MAVNTAQLYLDSLKDQRPMVHILGEKVENVYEHPLIRYMLNLLAETYELANDPKGKQYLFTDSELIGEDYL